jgi:hypothetical protein
VLDVPWIECRAHMAAGSGGLAYERALRSVEGDVVGIAPGVLGKERQCGDRSVHTTGQFSRRGEEAQRRQWPVEIPITG